MMVKWEKVATTVREQMLASLMESGVQQGIFPGGVACLIQEGAVNVLTCGTLSQESLTGKLSEAFRSDTLFDLASLTKVTVTLPCILLSVQEGKLRLDDRVTMYLPEFSGFDAIRKDITIHHLLTHTSGLPAWRPYFTILRSKEAYLQAIAAEPLEREPGETIIYSDLGFMLLGWVLERIWGERLDRIAQRLVFDPLGMRTASFRPRDAEEIRNASVAPTELGNEFERGMALSYMDKFESGMLPEGSFGLRREQLSGLNWRREPICGEVHDANCYYGLQGISGHAGLFSTVWDLERYMKMWGKLSLIMEPLCQSAVRCQAESGTLKRGLGWELYANELYGHTGFTGTSIYRHDRMDMTVIILTNRIHPVVKDGMIEWRAVLRQALFTSQTD
ncbi:CubicO group peptidase, beta-lactamase class C family [Paenibacillus sp. yr247]|uniref:serine hydrolase domain-containing protein n=1 Tax=Paenibacillus sp. yr247 TaxID=1761880 RepID=UPI000884532B|nr:serine hydrolase domain-containing protein [Paenibacillus sp. yr247]SDN94594.1 CubicO group peptidase, beta-lactamase class C family [Paenibacillus sp. yr247]